MSSVLGIEQTQAGIAAGESSTRQVVGFRLGDEQYGIEITMIQEIILLGEITGIPQVPSYIEGLINLRGSVIPIIDLRKRFRLPTSPFTDDTRVVVVNVHQKTIGLIVDAVTQVRRIAVDQIDSAPTTVMGQEHISGLAKLDEGLLILMDVSKVLDHGPVETTERVNR